MPVVLEVAAGTRPSMQVFGDDYGTRDGTCIRDYIHVDDLTDAHLAAMDYLSSHDDNLTVNLGTGHGYTVLEVIDAARRITGRDIAYTTAGKRPGDCAELVADASLAGDLIGWKAKRSDIDNIIESMWRVYSRSD